MGLFIAGALTLVVVGLVAWYYPQLKSRAGAARRARAFGALAGRLGIEPADGAAFADAGFMPTVQSIFGPHGELRHVIVREADGETTYLFEYLFGARPAASHRRGVAVVAVHLGKPVPMFTLSKPRGPARSRTTDLGARGQRLVVQAIGELELWSLKGERKRARSMVTPLIEQLNDDTGWNIRGIDDWLVMFNEKTQGSLDRFWERAGRLRALLR